MCVSIENRAQKFTQKSIKNEKLREYTNILLEDSINIRANLLHMSAVMALIESKKNDGILEEFNNSIVEFAEARLGIGRAQAYSMVNVGKTFLDSDGKPLIIERGGKWNNTQLMALLPMAGSGEAKRDAVETRMAVNNLIDRGLIKPSMKVADIKEVIKEQRPDAKRLEKKKEEKEHIKKEKRKAEKKIKGELTAKVEFYIIDGKLQMAYNGQVETFNDNLVNVIVDMFHQCVNYKM